MTLVWLILTSKEYQPLSALIMCNKTKNDKEKEKSMCGRNLRKLKITGASLRLETARQRKKPKRKIPDPPIDHLKKLAVKGSRWGNRRRH